jgi:hypothetical protein
VGEVDDAKWLEADEAPPAGYLKVRFDRVVDDESLQIMAVSASTLIWRVKQELEKEAGIPAHQISLYHRGEEETELEDGSRLERDSTLLLIIADRQAYIHDSNQLTIHEARYGWAGNLFGRKAFDVGCKDVTDIVRQDIKENELHLNPTCEARLLNSHFWPGRGEPALDWPGRGEPANDVGCKLGIRYSYGDGLEHQLVTAAVWNETVCLHITPERHQSYCWAGFCCCGVHQAKKGSGTKWGGTKEGGRKRGGAQSLTEAMLR